MLGWVGVWLVVLRWFRSHAMVLLSLRLDRDDDVCIVLSYRIVTFIVKHHSFPL